MIDWFPAKISLLQRISYDPLSPVLIRQDQQFEFFYQLMYAGNLQP